MSGRLREWIEGDGVHLIDGAMGTVLYESGVFVNQCYDELNLSEPDLVLGVHADYVRSGAQLIETNTFGANPVKLEPFGLEPSVHEINAAAARLARQAAGERAEVLGAIGPLGIRIEPWGPTSVDEATDLFGRQVAGLAEGGVDGFMLETFSDLDELLQAVRAVRKVAGDAPVFAQMTFGDAGHTEYGATIEAAAAALEGAGADVIGLNCSVGPSSMLFGVERMVAATSRPVSASPNAGLPRDIGDRKIYLASPEYMARYARRMVETGARFVGGCCGTSPEHTRLTATLLGTNGPGPARVAVPSPSDAGDRGAAEPPPLADRSALGRRLARGEFVGGVELTPPHGWDPGELVAGAARLRDAGVHTVHIVDGPAHRSRIASLPAAIVIERELDVETVPHYSCRDRNMLGMLSDLLGAAAAGLRNVFLITGDPPRGGPYDTGGVYDIDSIGLTNVVRQLNLGLDPGGSSIGAPTSFVKGVAVNPGAVDPEEEIRRFAWKAEAGADFAVTQPIFDPEKFLAFVREIEGFGVPLLAGLWPPLSLENAEFLAHEVPGVDVPSEVLERMARAQQRGAEATAREGVDVAREVLDAIRPHVAGALVSTPGNDVDRAAAVLEEL